MYTSSVVNVIQAERDDIKPSLLADLVHSLLWHWSGFNVSVPTDIAFPNGRVTQTHTFVNHEYSE